jgi:diacylglycerol kinase
MEQMAQVQFLTAFLPLVAAGVVLDLILETRADRVAVELMADRVGREIHQQLTLHKDQMAAGVVVAHPITAVVEVAVLGL